MHFAIDVAGLNLKFDDCWADKLKQCSGDWKQVNINQTIFWGHGSDVVGDPKPEGDDPDIVIPEPDPEK